MFKSADVELKTKIDSVENELKEQKCKEVFHYFEELCEANGLAFITFDNANINVTLSASMKSLKEQAKSFIDRICSDLTLIDTQKHKDEIMVEYKKSLNVSNAITMVVNRYKAIEEEKAKQSERKAKEEETKKIEAVVYKEPETLNQVEEVSDEPLSAPTVEDEILTMSFKVTANIGKLKELKSYMDERGYEYE